MFHWKPIVDRRRSMRNRCVKSAHLGCKQLPGYLANISSGAEMKLWCGLLWHSVSSLRPDMPGPIAAGVRESRHAAIGDNVEQHITYHVEELTMKKGKMKEEVGAAAKSEDRRSISHAHCNIGNASCRRRLRRSGLAQLQHASCTVDR